MLTAALCLLILNTVGLTWADYIAYTQPEQIHIAYGEKPSEMYVVWSTAENTKSPSVRYFVEHSTRILTAQGVSRKFTDEGSEKRVQYIHRVKVTGLTPGQKYTYTCGSAEGGWSDVFSFTAMPNGSDWSPRLCVYGDLGNINPKSLPRIQQETQMGMYDAVLHVGDFAYDMFEYNGRRGDEFMKQIEPVAAYIPYMTTPGNHERYENFSNYRHRFVMPGDELSDNMFFSFNMGPAHIISFSTEYYYYGIPQAHVQNKWLEQELTEASKPENRAKHPWLITMGHRPMYCSNNDSDDCTKNEDVIRTGSAKNHLPSLEKLFYKYGVDLELWAHEHSYERLWPIYDRKVYNGSMAEPYTNPTAPVHIITGSAGCYAAHEYFKNHTADWSAFRSHDYGFTRITVHNASHLSIDQVSDDQDGKIIDSVMIKKDNHGPYPPRPWHTMPR